MAWIKAACNIGRNNCPLRNTHVDFRSVNFKRNMNEGVHVEQTHAYFPDNKALRRHPGHTHENTEACLFYSVHSWNK